MLPMMYRVKKKIPYMEPIDTEEKLLNAIGSVGMDNVDLSGLTVGITAGSRGISEIAGILKALVQYIKRSGGSPFLIPSMGSHGGGTIEGQLEVIKSLGISYHTVGAPLLESVDADIIGTTPSGIPVYFNTEAAKLDRIIIINRIKPHTDFSGEIESGICKMMAIGLGGPKGAISVHSHALVKGYENVIKETAAAVIDKMPVLFALGILENYKHQISDIAGILPEDIITQESRLLSAVKESTMKLPFDAIDVLVVREAGKDISGTGMDTKVVGRIMIRGQKEPELPRIGRIVVLGLTPESHGNALGIGLADITTRKVFEKIDVKATSLNAFSSMTPEQGRIPCVADNDFEAINYAVATLGAIGDRLRIVIIQNTLELENFAVSEAMVNEAKRMGMEIVGEKEPFEFDSDGNLKNLSF